MFSSRVTASASSAILLSVFWAPALQASSPGALAFIPTPSLATSLPPCSGRFSCCSWLVSSANLNVNCLSGRQPHFRPASSASDRGWSMGRSSFYRLASDPTPGWQGLRSITSSRLLGRSSFYRSPHRVLTGRHGRVVAADSLQGLMLSFNLMGGSEPHSPKHWDRRTPRPRAPASETSLWCRLDELWLGVDLFSIRTRST